MNISSMFSVETVLVLEFFDEKPNGIIVKLVILGRDLHVEWLWTNSIRKIVTLNDLKTD